ncbi:MAG: hypothetical protein PHV30_00025 [Candidatus Margulisbacteria bacterium]|nr:hypothetical protein [Candidatus Margulisiibacteriota bacterium]
MRIVKGLLFGLLAGILDVLPMLVQRLSWDANISALSLWIISGYLITVTDIKINSVLKGLLVSFLILMPCAVLIGAKEPSSLIPISIMTIILGSGLGYVTGRFNK